MIHSDNRLTCAITLTLFATGIALSVLLIAAYSRPFTGETSVRPELLRQVIVGEAAVGNQPLVLENLSLIAVCGASSIPAELGGSASLHMRVAYR